MEGEERHHHEANNFTDYNEAVTAYRKTFASKADVVAQTPDPAIRNMVEYFSERGIETVWDRFDKQKPHCNFGLAGICCKNCSMGPCRITKKAPKGTCGADADLIVARNLLRAVAAGTSSHGWRGRETMLALKAAAEGKLDLPIDGESKIRATAKGFGINAENKTLNQLASEVADKLLEDLTRTIPDKHNAIYNFAPKERVKRWEELGIMPIGTMHEVFDCLHRSTTGTDGDWKNTMQQLERTGLAFAWGSCFGTATAQDCLFGLPRQNTVKANLGALKDGFVNIAVHGHSPVLVSEIVRQGRTEKYIELAKQAGAKGIQFYGICCSGLSAMYRYADVIPLSNAVGAELVLGTGALDLWVADVQDVFPTIMEVADCVKTTVVTTNDAARLPGSEFYGYDHYHSNFDQTSQLAQKIIQRAIRSFSERRDVPRHIPPYSVDAMTGYSIENLTKSFGGLQNFFDAIKTGKIRGVINLVGCNNPRLVHEKQIVEVADELVKHNFFIMTNGCASFALIKMGFCNMQGWQKGGTTAREFLEPKNLPPVVHMGECLDNARANGMFKTVAEGLDQKIKDMPFAFVSPEWSNEKGICAALGFRLAGIDSYHCVYPPVQGSKNVEDYLYNGAKDNCGGVMKINVDGKKLAEMIITDLEDKRKKLGWN